MRTLRGRLYLLAILGGAASAIGCKKAAPPPPESSSADTAAAAPAPFAVSDVTLGKAIGADKRVASPSTTFGPKDTIYASVATTGSAPSKTLSAKWTFQDGQTVKADSQSIAPTGPAVTEFHLSKKSAWPAGKYKVEISVDAVSSKNKDFEIKK